MDRQQPANSVERPELRHSIDINPDSTTPRYDFVLPSYSRDRRVSSTTSTVPPETIIHANSTNINISIPDQNSSSQGAANTIEGIINVMSSTYYEKIVHHLMLFFLLIRRCGPIFIGTNGLL
jgi:hypothetical protein